MRLTWKHVSTKIVHETKDGPIHTDLFEYQGNHPKVAFGTVTFWRGEGVIGYSKSVDSPSFFPEMGAVCYPLDSDLDAWELERDLSLSVQSDGVVTCTHVYCRDEV
jgi:hypothetical protein